MGNHCINRDGPNAAVAASAPAKPKDATGTSKPRLLCLHGGGSNNDITPYQTEGLRLSQRVDCVYLHAPHEVKYCYPGLRQFSDGPWYVWADPMAAQSVCGRKQWDDSLEYLAGYVKKHGPFDGVYGFSQGTAMISSLSHPSVWRERFQMERPPWRFAVLACGGASFQVSLEKGAPPIEMPSFHIFGNKDRHLPDSKAISEYWDASQRTICSHDSGHEIDMQMWRREEEMMSKLDKFLDEQLPSTHV